VARVDDYKESLRIASDRLRNSDLDRLARYAGAAVERAETGETRVKFPFLGTPMVVQVGNSVQLFKENDPAEISLPEKILLCHYLLHASEVPASGQFINFRQIPDGHFYDDAFQRRARDPLLATFGRNLELFGRCAGILNGIPVAAGDVGMSFAVFPRMNIHLVLWRGDEEFPPDANILFDDNIRHNFPAEDVAVISGMLVYRLMGIARAQSAAN
jgi:hypothetical protein